jgi:16S rRNA (cytidine1402-2'-O)-methyltransferase
MSSLFIVSTPIGNLEDITIRAMKVLFAADVILCEDTRHTGNLLNELRKRYPALTTEHKPMLVAYYDEIEDKKIPEVVGMLEEGRNLALVSDAGTPLVSDPGFRLVRECIKRNIKVESIPGASAILTALTSSGLPSDKFSFLGYLPEKQGQRLKLLGDLPQMSKLVASTYIAYCAPHKLEQTLVDIKEVLGDIEITIARELTKIHEEVWKGTVTSATEQFKNPQGEFVLLFNLA